MGLQLLKEASLLLQREAFFKDIVHVPKKQLDMLVDLKGKVASSSKESAAISRNFGEKSPGLFSNIDQCIDGASSGNETFMYCDTSSTSFRMLKTFRDDHDGNWVLHL